MNPIFNLLDVLNDAVKNNDVVNTTLSDDRKTYAAKLSDSFLRRYFPLSGTWTGEVYEGYLDIEGDKPTSIYLQNYGTLCETQHAIIPVIIPQENTEEVNKLTRQLIDTAY